MSRFSGNVHKYGKGAMREVQRIKRAEAEERNAHTPDQNRRQYRLAEIANLEAALAEE